MQIVFLSIVLSIILGSHFYIGKRLFGLLGLTGASLKTAWVILALLIVSVVLAMILSRGELLGNFVVDKLVWLGFAWFGLMFMLVMATLAADVVSLGIWGAGRVFTFESGLWIVRVRSAFYVLTVVLGVVAMFDAQRWPEVVEVPVSIPNLPPEFENYRIAHLTDTHIGPILRTAWAEKLVEITNGTQADLIVHSGDIIDGSVAHIGDMVRPLAKLRAPDGVLFVSGNHEVYSQSNPWLKHLRTLGFQILDNRHLVLEREGAQLVIAGVSDHNSGRDSLSVKPDPQQAFAGAPKPGAAPRIFLAHQPLQARSVQNMGVNLQLSGHTHGGQFWPFHYFIYLQQPIRSGLGMVGDVPVFVSNGAGFWGPPLRLFARAQIPVIALRKE